MNRLTIKAPSGLIHLKDNTEMTMNVAIKKLSDFEDLEEQNRLIKLPCAVGDTVYVKMQFGGYAEAEVRDFSFFLSCGFCIVVTSDKFDKQHIPFVEFGKTVFFTIEEAKAASKELERGKGE